MRTFSAASKRINLLPRHNGMSKAAPQTVSVLVAKRSRSPGYPLWVALDPERGHKNKRRQSADNGKAVQPGKFGSFQKRFAMTKSPSAIIFTTSIVKAR